MALPSCSPLRELKNQNNLAITNGQNVEQKPILTPK
jgi:hypothetical protein